MLDLLSWLRAPQITIELWAREDAMDRALRLAHAWIDDADLGPGRGRWT